MYASVVSAKLFLKAITDCNAIFMSFLFLSSKCAEITNTAVGCYFSAITTYSNLVTGLTNLPNRNFA